MAKLTSLNPILVKYEFDDKKILIETGKTYEKKHLHLDKTFTLYTHTQYYMKYNYSNDICSSFSMLTNYLPLKNVSGRMPNKLSYCVLFDLNINCDNEEERKFRDFIVSTSNEIKKRITETTETENIIFSFPYIESDESSFKIYLKSINRQENSNSKIKTNYNVCPIMFHQSKSRGGNVVTINKDEINKTCNNIYKEMPLFKNKLYMKTQTDEKYSNVKNIYYVGKFVVEFKIELSTYFSENSNKKYAKCNIYLVATEMEIKHNVSYCKSVLYEDIVNVNIKSDELHSVTI